MDRRRFLQNSGIAVGTLITPGVTVSTNNVTSRSFKPESWLSVREQFLLKHERIQMAQMLFASHPAPVREAIDRYRLAFDQDPAVFFHENWIEKERAVAKAAARYMRVDPDEIVLTDNTTQGLALLYNGLMLKPGDEIISTTHDHYVTDKSLEYASKKKGATRKVIEEYADPAIVSVDEVVDKISRAITARTRIVAITWVHSCTGVKLPVRAIADRIAEINQRRSDPDRIYLCVDGVHGFGNQDDDISSLGCDFFSAGTHKWIFGPRGTGILWGRKDAWSQIAPTIPPFRFNPIAAWLDLPAGEMTPYDLYTPGGFYTYEYRWALREAFEFQMAIGRDRVHQRTTELNTRLKEQLLTIPNLRLHTPVDSRLSAGINCFELKGMGAQDLVAKLYDKGIIASDSPYKISYARLTPCIINHEDEVDQCIKALAEI